MTTWGSLMGDVGIMGLHVPGMAWREIRESAVLAEDLGYSCLTMGESWGEDAFTSLAQLAAVTSRIRIGTSIVPVFARSPANLAMTALNMDRMSEGRFFLGLGTSGQLVIQDLHGEKFQKPLTRMREYIDIIRKAARGESLDHDGEFFHTKRFRLRGTPYRPTLPIYIASLSPASLRLTGELADGWLPIYLAPARMAVAAAEVKAAAEAAGRSLRDIAISPQVSIYVTDDIAAARDRERPHIAFYIGGMGVFYHQYMHRIGFGAEADRVRQAYQTRERDKAAQLVTDEMVDAMTIIGRPPQCRDQMQAFFDAGVQEVRLVFNEPNKEAYLKAMKAVAPRG
jgi:F420-dependent oxidoreductase-like protein